MLTSALITLIKKAAPTWSRDNIRVLINEIQRLVLSRRTTGAMRMYSASGTDVVLTTTSGDYDYDIDTTNGFDYDAWRITDVYSSAIDEPTDVLCYDATQDTSAKIVFKSNPGASTYYIRAYRKPTAIDSESDQLEIPEGYHLTHVFEGVMGLIEKMDSGKSDRWEKFERILLPQMLHAMNEPNLHSETSSLTRRGY